MACRTSIAEFEASKFHPSFYGLLTKLHRMVELKVTNPAAYPSRPATRAHSPPNAPHEEPSAQMTTEQQVPHDLDGQIWADLLLANDETRFDIEDLWSSFFGPGNGV